MRLAFPECQYDGFPERVANYLRSEGTYDEPTVADRLMLIRARVSELLLTLLERIRTIAAARRSRPQTPM